MTYCFVIPAVYPHPDRRPIRRNSKRTGFQNERRHAVLLLMQNPQAAFSDVVGSAVTLKPASADPEDAWEPTTAETAPGGQKPSGHSFDPNDLSF